MDRSITAQQAKDKQVDLCLAIIALRERVKSAEQMVNLLLPMAKGYAANNRRQVNDDIIDTATLLLASLKDSDKIGG